MPDHSEANASKPSAQGLPEAPSLEERHFRTVQVGNLQALVPAAEPYACSNPKAPALLLVPGLGMDAMGFVRQLPLGAISNLHLFQTPNHPVDGEPGVCGFARHVEDYIAASGLDRHPGGVVLGGCSMGGALSLCVAIRRRVALRGLVLIGTFGDCRHLPFWQRAGAPLAWVVPFRVLRILAWHAVAYTSFFGAGVTPAEADWLVACKLRHTQRYFAAAVAALTRQRQTADAAGIKLPTLVLHGTKDMVLPHAAGAELAQTIPGAKLITVPGAGHAFFFTHHQAVNAGIAGFLRQL
jgi:pimeloyl-ACP methyl ester carboxylesterase